MNRNKLIDYLNQNNGYIKTRDFEKLGIPRPSIIGYIDKKIIRKHKIAIFRVILFL